MSIFPKKSKKKVKMAEEHNTYHTMDDDESDVNAITSEVNNLCELEETYNLAREAANKQLEKLRQDRKEKEHKIEELSKHTGLHRKSIELGDSYMSELLEMTYKIRETFQSVSNSIQHVKEELQSINEIDKEVHSQNDLNTLSLERLNVNYSKTIEAQVKNISSIENEAREIKQFGEERVNRLSAQIDQLKVELVKGKVDFEEKSELIHLQEKEHEGLTNKLNEIKTSIGEVSLEIQETNLKRDGLIADMKSFESLYECEMKSLNGKCETLSERVSQQSDSCKKLDDELQMENATSASINESKIQLDKDSEQLFEEMNISKDLYTKLNDQKNILLESFKMEEVNTQNSKEEIKGLLGMEISTKDIELQSLNQLKENEENLKSELMVITNTINTGSENSTKLNNSIVEFRQEKQMMEETIDKLETSIKETELKMEQIQTEGLEYANQLQNETLELEQNFQEIQDKINTDGTTFQADYENKKTNFKIDLEDIDKRNMMEIIDLNKSIGELQHLYDDLKQSVKLLENNVDGTQSECDVISRKILILERSLREGIRQKKPVVPPIKRSIIENMSDSSDDGPNILEIFKKKKEAEMKKAKAKRSRNK